MGWCHWWRATYAQQWIFVGVMSCCRIASEVQRERSIRLTSPVQMYEFNPNICIWLTPIIKYDTSLIAEVSAI